MPNRHYSAHLQVEVDGSPLPEDIAVLLTYGYVEDSRAVPDVFVLRFRDKYRVVLAKSGLKIGAPVRLFARLSEPPGAPRLLLSGEVTAVEAEWEAGGSVTEVRGLDHAHRLFRGRRVAAYAEMTVADIVRKVAQRAGLKVGQVDDAPGLAGTPGTQVTQDNVSDWEFLSRLAEAAGAQCAVVDGKLEFTVPSAPSSAPASSSSTHTEALLLKAGSNLISLRAAISAAEQVPRVQVRGWDYLNKQAVTATVPAAAAGTDVPGADPAALGRQFGSPDLVATDVPYRTQAAAQTAARALADQVAGGFAELDGVARGNPMLRAGAAVTLSEVGAPFEGKYTLTSTRHLFHGGDVYTTAFVASGRSDRSLYGVIHGGTGARPGARRAPAPGGLVPALVSDVNDPQKLGRVRLKFPWLADDYTSGWARTLHLGGGSARGLLMLPEVGDEVLVGFEQGDFNAPYVLGGLWNGTDKPPVPAVAVVDAGNGQITGRYMISRTGHRLALVESGSGPNEARLATGDGRHTLVLDQQGTKITVHSDGTVLVEGRKGVTVDAGTGALELKGKSVSISSTGGEITVKATGALNMSATTSAKMSGQQATVSGTSAAELSASGATTVRGTPVRIN
jgi:uncharacterized protein involved in type VI secretion and phage assembly